MNTTLHHKHINNREKFSHFLMSQCLSVRRGALMVGLLLYIAFAVMDVIKFPSEVYTLTLTARLTLVILPLLYLNFVYWYKPPLSIRSDVFLLLFIYLGAGLNHTIVYYVSQLHGFEFSQLGLVLLIMFGCLLMVLPIKPSGIVTVLILSIFTAVNIYINHPLADLIFVLVILGFVTGICLTVNRIGQKRLYQNYILINRLYNESITDGLTKLNNRRAFQEQVVRLNAIAVREKATLGLIFVDADYFKIINDSFGHGMGDEVLKKLAEVIEAKCRRTEDIGFRIGGDEFALILYGVNKEKLTETCLEIVEDVANFNLNNNGQIIKTSVSVGATLKFANTKITSENLVKTADKYLYQAKRNGRNQHYLKAI
ncbi:GGDEF domain-containing protein [Colwellia sp. C1TZA3]|uniref:GGDEF domain-containing protein n=1 Tax=Colwellia sp. C1TZA3 TaxID=2508879 RepID=UPI0011B96367|nr:GGDEF domain-containing protein [Colwellia sp. C1TZA3]TWX72615.1 GGDEF domain-containing protein [Colwellia sp. C1TZA3]